MWKFITVTFLFLGFAFYELSGGDEFDAEALRLSRIDPVTSPIAPSTQMAEAPRPAPATVPETVVAQKTLSPEPETPDATTAVAAVATAEDTSVTRASFSPSTGFSTGTAVGVEEEASAIVLPSLIASATPEAESEEVVAEELAVANTTPVIAADLREVTGSRVNVRGGPGTNYGVINSLTRGAEVEVLEDLGNGWVRLRPVDGGPVGWMADFLLTQG